MTISMHMTIEPETRRAIEKPRRPLDSIADLPTNLITLPPAFLDALREIAPKVRPRRMRYVMALAAAAALALVLGRQPVVRRHAAQLVTALARPFERAPAVPAVAVSPAAPSMVRAALAPAPRPDSNTTSVPDTTASPARAPISVDDLPPAPTPKAKKNPRWPTTR
jgi:hypothetical protein